MDARSRYWLSQSATSKDCLHFHVLRGALLGRNRPSVSTTFSWPSSCWRRFQQKAWCAAWSSWWLAFHQMHSALRNRIQICHLLQPRSKFVVTNNLESLHLYRGLKKFLVAIKQSLHWSVRLVCLYLGGEGGRLNALLRPSILMTSTCSCHPLWQDWLQWWSLLQPSAVDVRKALDCPVTDS